MYKGINLSNIAFDLDGTCVDFTKSFIEIAENQYGITGFTSDQILTYEIEDHIALNRNDCGKIVQFIIENPFESNLTFIQNARETLEEFMEIEQIIFITSRHVIKPIVKWLSENFENNNFQVYNVLKPHKKLKILHDLNIKYYIDDRLVTCELLSQFGFYPILYNQPWNQMNTKIPTIFSWNEIRDLLQ